MPQRQRHLPHILISVLTLFGFLTLPFVAATTANASVISTSGPISSIEMSNATITEQSGQLFLFNATNITSSDATTGITTVFGSGTATWANGLSSGSFTSGTAASVPLTRGYNTITITHSASGTDTTYKIFVTRGGQFTGFEFRTSGITITPAFSPDVHTYTLSDVPYSVSSFRYVVTETFNEAGRLTCTRCDWWQYNGRGEVSMSLAAGDNAIDWSYFPEQIYGGTTEHYIFNIHRAAAFDASTLSNLTLSNSTLTEQSGQLYKFSGTNISSDTATTGVTATFATGTATWANGIHSGSMTSGVTASVPLTRGYNTIEVAHTASGVTTTYRVYVTRGGQFTGFEFSTPGITITPAFSPDVHTYTLSDVPYSVSSFRYVVTETFNEAGRLTCTRCDWWQYFDRGEVSMSLAAGDNAIDWSYFPEEIYGGVTEHYIFNIHRAAAFDASTLSNLTLSNSTLTEQSGQLYKFDGTNISSNTATTGVTATFATGTATWTNGLHSGSMTSGTAASVPLTRGYNTIEVAHTANGVTTTYRVYVTRGGQFTGFDIRTPGVTITPAFDPDIHYYTLSDVPYATSSLRYQITETFNEAGRLTCTGCDWWQFFDRGEVGISLSVGSTCIDWTYFPENIYGGPNEQRYYFSINRNAPGSPATGLCVPPAPTTTTIEPPTTTTIEPPTTTTTASPVTTTLPRATTTSTSVPTATTTPSPTTPSVTTMPAATAPISTATTVAPTSAAPAVSPVITVAQGQASVVTIAPTASTTPVVPTGLVSSGSVNNATPTTSTTTTAPPLIKNVATPGKTEPAPTAQVVSPGSAAATVDGQRIQVTITRENNQLVFTGAGITGTLSGTNAAGQPIALDTDGNLRIQPGDTLTINSTGLKAQSKVAVWMFSTPTKAGEIFTDLSGNAAGSFIVSEKLENGNHRVVLKEFNPAGEEVVMTLGIVVGAVNSTSTLSRVLIAIPITLAIGFGIALPTQARRRRRRAIA